MTEITTQDIKELFDGEEPAIFSPSLKVDKYTQPSGDAKGHVEVDKIVKCYNDDYCPNATRQKLNSFFKHPKAKECIVELKGNLIVNHSGGILENAGLCLHRNLGYAMIPGSAVKGCCRHYAWEQWNNEKDETKKEEQAEWIADTFGYPTGEGNLDGYLATAFPEKYGSRDGNKSAYAGNVAFLPAIPKDISRVKLVADVLTCHHQNYYGGRQAKALDNESPIPVFFPAVKESSTFVFQIVPLRGCVDIDRVLNCLKEMLEVQGVGSKTSAGYGWFAEDEATKIARLFAERERLKKEQEEKEKAAARKAQEENAARIKAENDEKERMEKERILNQNMEEFLTLNWQKFSKKITEMFEKAEGVFADEQRQQLADVIVRNEKIKPKDLKGGEKSLNKWLGEELAKDVLAKRGN